MPDVQAKCDNEQHVPDMGEMENAYRISVTSLGVKSA